MTPLCTIKNIVIMITTLGQDLWEMALLKKILTLWMRQQDEKEAKTILSNKDATQKEINNSRENLRKAISELKKKEDSSNTNGSGNNNNNTRLATTGGTSPVAVGLFGTMVSLVGAFMVIRKKDNSR
jgi:LPXTG-motif cell wall-anchored protein